MQCKHKCGLNEESRDILIGEKEKAIAQKSTSGEHSQATAPSSTIRREGPFEEKLLLGIIWDKTKFKHDRVIRGELVEELILI